MLGDVALILSKLDLYDVEKVVLEPYHREGPGRPPRNPMGIFKALVVKRLRQIPSDRELYRRLWNDPRLRMICDIEDRERPYHPSQLTRFRRNVGPERLEGIMKELVGELVEGGVIRGETVAMDAMFIKAYSKRDLHDNRLGTSDLDVRVGGMGGPTDLETGPTSLETQRPTSPSPSRWPLPTRTRRSTHHSSSTRPSRRPRGG